MKRAFQLLIGLCILFFGIFIVYNYYGYIFAKTVEGRVIGVNRANEQTAVVGTGIPIPTSQLFSFAIAIKDVSGEIFAASSEDRQWAVVKEGMCAQAKLFPYPPWELNASGTYHGARLLKLYDCPVDAPGPTSSPAAGTGTPSQSP